MQTILLNIILKIQVLLLGPASWLDGMFEGIAKKNLNEILDASEFAKPIDGLFLVIGRSNSSNVYSDLWGDIQLIIKNNILPVGIALVTTYFIMSLIDMASKDNTTLEHYIREFIKLIIAVTVVNQSWAIICYLLRISESILYSIEFNGGVTTPDDLVNQILNDSDNGGYIVIWFTSILPWLIKKVAVLALYVCVFMRTLDVAWRATLLPIGAANLFDGGTNSPGVKYIKSLFGALLSGAMVMVILKLSSTFLLIAYELATNNGNGIATGASGVAIGMIAMSGAEIAIVGACFGASTKVKEVFS